MSISEKEFDLIVQKLQELSFADARVAFGDKGFERWRNPRFNAPLETPDGVGKLTGGCGDTMEIFIKLENNRVQAASYRTDGCGASGLCGSFTAELSHGKTVEELLDLTPEDVLQAIGTFPRDDEHCAKLAILTLQDAVNDYMIKSSKIT